MEGLCIECYDLQEDEKNHFFPAGCYQREKRPLEGTKRKGLFRDLFKVQKGKDLLR